MLLHDIVFHDSGTSQLRHLDKDAVMGLLPLLIPKDWYQQEKVAYNPSSPSASGYPPATWLRVLWTYLRRHLPGDLSMVAGLPILPTVDREDQMQIIPLALPSTTLIHSALGVTLDRECCSILAACGLEVVEDLPDYVETHAAVVGNYIRLPLPEDVMDAISTAVRVNKAPEPLEKTRDLTTLEERRKLRSFLSRVNPGALGQPQKDILGSLPIFEVYNKNPGSPVECVSLDEVGKAAPLSMPPIDITNRLVDLSDREALGLAKIIGVVPMTSVTLLSETVLQDCAQGRCTQETIHEVMTYITEHMPALIAEDPNFRDFLKDIPFVTTCSGCMACPKDLFSPESAFLKQLFYGEDAFPSEDFCHCFMSLLRQLGLREESSVCAGEILTSAKRVEMGNVTYHDKDEDPAIVAKAEAILQFLTRNPSVLQDTVDGEMLSACLLKVAWVPTQKERPPLFPSSLPWFQAGKSCSRPSEVKSLDWFPLVGSVVPLLKVSVSWEVAAAFQWNRPPTVEQIVDQLEKVVMYYLSEEKTKYMAIITSIYDELMKGDICGLQEVLLGKSLDTWIWHGDGFISSEKITVQPAFMDLRPYLYALPPEITQYKEMFLQCGVHKHCDAKVYANVLHRIKDKYLSEETVETPTVNRDLQLAINILNRLRASMNLMDPALLDLILVPIACDEENTVSLVPVENATYCDTEWLRQGFDLMEFDEQDGITFIHPLLPVATAEALRVPTLMSRMLHAEELSVTGFGQSESLTNRLKHLLEDYTDGLAIPKELIQNADDAGATEIKFLYDERTNKDHAKYLIDEGMKECHGPALWVQNNAVFSEEDFDSITKLGGATKEMYSDKIGKFGLGFNAVFNITDVPSFISRNYLVILDPHTYHLGRGIKDRTRPGIRIDMNKNKTLLQKLPDQFQPYDGVFDCEINAQKEAGYEGTLFRFPLRTRQQAVRSEISGLHYDRREMEILLGMLIKAAPHLLLFTQNITSLKVYHVGPEGHDPKDASLIFQVNKETVKVPRALTSTNIRPISYSRSGLKTAGSTVSSEFNVLKMGTEFMEQLDKSGSGDPSITDIPAMSTVIKVVTKTTEEGETLLPKHPVAVKEYFWLLSFAVGCEKALSLALQARSLHKGYNPIGAVAVPLKNQEDGFVPVPLSEIGSKGITFCWLPLPTQSGLPIHINGSFAIQSSRRQLTEKTEDDKGSSQADWNEAVLEDSVCRAYVQLLRDAQIISPAATAVRYYDLWPCKADVPQNMLPLLSKFYEHLVSNRKVPIWHDGFQLITMERAVFLDPTLTGSQMIAELAIEAFKQNNKSSNVVELPQKVLDSFSTTGHMEFIDSKTYSQNRFFGEVFFRDVLNIPSETRDPLILYALDRHSKDLEAMLRTSACIPVSPDGKKLRRPSDLVNPISPLSELYSPEDGRFPHSKEFLDSNRLDTLRKLGMQDQDLGWTDVVERAQSLKKLNDINPEAASTRLLRFLAFLHRKISMSGLSKQEMSADQLRERNWAQCKLQQIEMLPVMEKPERFPLPWKGAEFPSHTLMAPEDVHGMEARHLVSSTQPVVDDSHILPSTKAFLGLSGKEIRIGHVVTQLENALVVDTKSLTYREFKDLLKACYKIYSFLQDQCSMNEEMRLATQALLSDRKCILVKKEFLAPRQLAFSFASDCSPYLYGVPPDMARKFTPLLIVLGVRQEFSVGDHILVIQQLHKSAESLPLEGKELEVAKQSLTLLGAGMAREELTASEVEQRYGTVYIPNASGVLQPSKDLCFNDCPWLPAVIDVHFTHSDITYKTSVLLGVKTKRQEAIRTHAHGIPFGQKECLTNILKRILNGYAFDHEILKELIQNADDAKATEIHFVTDCRNHSKRCVFTDSWIPLQGPALCVYNNMPFTASDLEGIQRLGEGSKVQDPNKTGQYGIGFSSVYHLTDVPSFLTGGKELEQTLCVFDPHCLYVPGATTMEPGMQFTDLPQLKETFPDVFSCYLEDIFKLENGTLFRFPLRIPPMAEQSDISKINITMSKVQSLLKGLKGEIFEVLLFTNSITKICLSDIDITSGELGNSYTVWAKLSEEDQQKRDEFYQHIQRTTAALKKGVITIDQIPCADAVYKMKICDTQGREETWIVSQQLGFPDREAVPDSVKNSFRNGDLMLLPRGGTACLLEKRIHGQIERDVRPGRAFCFLPLPVFTSLPVHINGHFALGYENRRHLWTNADGTGYKQDWNNFLSEEVIAPAYLNLLTHIRMQGLNTTMHDNVARVLCSRQILESAVQAYQQYFPDFVEFMPQWHPLVKAFYQKSASKESAILPAIREWPETAQRHQTTTEASQSWLVVWLPPKGQGNKKAFFSKLDKSEDIEEHAYLRFFSVHTQSAKKSERQILKQVLLDCNFNLLEATATVMQNYEKAKVEIDYMTPEGVLLFFQSYSMEKPMCGPWNLPADLYNTPFRDVHTLKVVLKYCKDDPQFLEKLQGTPLLLTKDNVLRVFASDSTIFHSEYHDLFPVCGDRFLHKVMLKEVFHDIKLEEISIFKTLDIEAFASIIASTMPEDKYYRNLEPVEWSHSLANFPNERWLRRLWTFISVQLSSKQTELQSMLEPLREWSIVPAHFRGSVYLVSLQNTTGILDLRDADKKQVSLCEVLRRLKLPELNVSLLSTDSKKCVLTKDLLTTRYVTTLSKPLAVLKLVHKTLMGEGESKPNGHDCDHLLAFFSEGLHKLNKCDESADLLRDLPVYSTVNGDLISLTGCLVYILPANIPTDNVEVWQSKSGTVFLELKDNLQHLYDFLGCATIDTVGIYCQFILQHFEYFTPEARHVHLTYLYHRYLKKNALDRSLSEEERQRLLQSLRNQKFIQDKDGKLRPARDFYDPENDLFRVMLPELKFPPRAGIGFLESEWLNFLRKLGLQSEVTKELVAEFTQQVAYEGIRDITSGSTRTKSKVLTKHLLEMQSPYKKEILKTVADTRFIAPEQVSMDLRSLYPQHGEMGDGKLPYISFRDSFSQGFEKLVWTRGNLLPIWADPMKQHQLPQAVREELMDCLGMCKAPSPKVVASHLVTLCEHLVSGGAGDWHDDREKLLTVKDVLKTAYHFLQENGLEDEDVKDRLSKTACILVSKGHSLAEPRYTSINLYDSEEIQSFLYKVPVELGEFHRLFQHLGATDKPTVDQYASVLQCLHDKVGISKLTPNELGVVFKAVKGIFEALESAVTKEICTTYLFLPSEGGRLVDSTKLVFNDAPHFYDRVDGFGLWFLVDLKECGLKFHDTEDLLNRLPPRLRPGMLSAFVKESLVESAKSSVTTSGIAATLGKRLTSEAFMKAVMRLIRHETHRSGMKLAEPAVFGVLDRLSTIRVYAADNLLTQLMYSGRPISGSQVEKTCFVEKIPGRPEIWNVYIKNDATLHHDLLIPLADVINSILAGILRDSVLYLLPILACSEEQIQRKLDSLNVRLDQSQATSRSPTMPLPGSQVPSDLFPLLKQTLATHVVGEFVAYRETEESDFLFAVTVEEVRAGMNDDVEERTYLVNLGEGMDAVVAPPSTLYRFERNGSK